MSPDSLTVEGKTEDGTQHPCSSCDAHCCRHVAVQLDTPTCKRDYDSIRWYLMHQDVWVSIDNDNCWLLEFRAACKNIAPDNSCGDYENRPRICRDYPSRDEYCERESSDLSYTHLFTDVQSFENYLDAQDIDWRYRRNLAQTS